MPPASSAEEQEGAVSQETAAGTGVPSDQDAKPSEQSSGSDPRDAKAAESSAAGDADAKSAPSLLDVVNKALEQERDGKSSGSDGQDGKSDAKAEGDGEKKTDAEAEAEEEKPPFHEHPRWKKVQAELKELRPLKQSIETLTPRAEAFDQLQTYVREAGLDTDEVNEGFAVMRAMKNDPERVIPVLEGYLERLRAATGHTLTPELKQKVSQGYVDEATALELSRTQSREARAAAAADAALKRAEEIQGESKAEATKRDVVAAVSEWDKRWSTSDPDYTLKVDRVKKDIRAHVLEFGPPATSQQAVEIAEKIRKDIDAEFKKLAPHRKPVQPSPAGGSSASATPSPKSSLDVVNLALGAAA